MSSLLALLRGLASQDVARANAGQAAVRMQNRRRQQEEVGAYLERLARDDTGFLEDDADRHAMGQ